MKTGTIHLGELQLTSLVMNASGPWANSKNKLTQLAKAGSGAIVTKTFTLEPAVGNPKPNIHFATNHSINSVGLTNKGSDYFIEAATIRRSQPMIASIYAPTLSGYAKLVKKLSHSNFDAIELNLSCPSKSTEPIAYYPDELDGFLKKIISISKLPVSAKLPPFVRRSRIKEITTVLKRHALNHIVLINSYPFALTFSDRKPVIKPNGGVGGMGGSYLKPIALAHVSIFRELLPNLPIIGGGGINTRDDVDDFLQAGAQAVQIGGAINRQGPKVLTELSRNY